MARKKKNSNYVTEKTIAAKEAKAIAERRKKTKKIIIAIAAAVAAVAIIVGIVFAIGIPFGMLDYKPEGTEDVVIMFEGYDEVIHIELYRNDAPITVKHFVDNLTDLKNQPIRAYKDGLLYFGSASADCGNSGIKGEFSENGVDNKISIRSGIIAVARGEDYNSGASQFFIATENATDLNGKYAAFAKITSGMGVIESIIDSLTYDENGNITNAPKIESIETHASHSH